MQYSKILLQSGIAISLLLIARDIFSRPTMPPSETLNKINIHRLSFIKSAQLALEKSSSFSLRDIAQQLIDDLSQDTEQLRRTSMEDNNYPPKILFEVEKFRFVYDYNEDVPFDLAYASHQLEQGKIILDLLHRMVRIPTSAVKDIAMRNIAIFTRYQSELTSFKENFMTINESRVRELAYQIWEAEGRPAGEDKRHWQLALRLLNDISSADLELAFKQKRSLAELFSTSSDLLINKVLH